MALGATQSTDVTVIPQSWCTKVRETPGDDGSQHLPCRHDQHAHRNRRMSLTRFRVLAIALLVISAIVLTTSILLLLTGEHGAWIGIIAVAIWIAVLIVGARIMRRRQQ